MLANILPIRKAAQSDKVLAELLNKAIFHMVEKMQDFK
jgi:hypothetical protein